MTDIAQDIAASIDTIERLRAMSPDPTLPYPLSRAIEVTDDLIAQCDRERAAIDRAFAVMPDAEVLRLAFKITISDLQPKLFTKTFIERRPNPSLTDLSLPLHNQYLYRVVGVPAPGVSELYDEQRLKPHNQLEGFEYPDAISAIYSWRVSLYPCNPLGFYNIWTDKTANIHKQIKRLRAQLMPSNLNLQSRQEIGEYMGNLLSTSCKCIRDIRDQICHDVAKRALWPYPLPGLLRYSAESAALHLPGLDWRPIYAVLAACRVKLHATPPTSLGEFLKPFWDIGIYELQFFDLRLDHEPAHFSPVESLIGALLQGFDADDFDDRLEHMVYTFMILPEVHSPVPSYYARLHAALAEGQRVLDNLEAEAVESELAAMGD